MNGNTAQQNIPNGWKVLPIGSHIKLQGGNAFSASNYVEEGIPLVRIGNVGKGDFVADDFVYISKDEHENNESVHLQDNDILMGMTGELGKVARIKKHHLPAVLNQRVGRVVFKDKELDPDFTFQIFLSDDFKSKLDKYFIGAAQKNISSSQVESVEVLLPPIKEQQKIAEILGAVDEDIAKTQEVIEATEKLKRGLMQQLFTRGIGHTKFKETKIGSIPDGWNLVQIKDAPIKIADGNYSAKYPRQDEFMKEGVPFVRVNNLKDQTLVKEDLKYISIEKHSELKKGHLKTNDVLITTRGQLGILALVPSEFDDANINAQIVLLRADNKTLLPKFLMHFLSSPEFQSQVFSGGSGSALQQLPIRVLENTFISLPTANEQQEIAEIFSAVDEKISVNKKLKEKLTLLKKGLMQDLLSGRVRTIIN